MVITAFVTGALARFAVPGPDLMPAWLTVLIGLIGTLGAGIVYAIAGADPPGWGSRASCARSLVLAYRRFVQKRAIWGPEAYRFRGAASAWRTIESGCGWHRP